MLLLQPPRPPPHSSPIFIIINNVNCSDVVIKYFHLLKVIVILGPKI